MPALITKCRKSGCCFFCKPLFSLSLIVDCFIVFIHEWEWIKKRKEEMTFEQLKDVKENVSSINTHGKMCQSLYRVCAGIVLQMKYCRCSRRSPLRSQVTVHPSVPIMLNGCHAIFRKPFFTNLTRTLEQPKSTHTHRTRVNTWVPKTPACMQGNEVTPPLLLLPFYLFILFIPLTASCPHLSRIYTLRAHKFNHSPWGTRITSRDHQLWLVSLGHSCFLPHCL